MDIAIVFLVFIYLLYLLFFSSSYCLLIYFLLIKFSKSFTRFIGSPHTKESLTQKNQFEHHCFVSVCVCVWHWGLKAGLCTCWEAGQLLYYWATPSTVFFLFILFVFVSLHLGDNACLCVRAQDVSFKKRKKKKKSKYEKFETQTSQQTWRIIPTCFYCSESCEVAFVFVLARYIHDLLSFIVFFNCVQIQYTFPLKYKYILIIYYI